MALGETIIERSGVINLGLEGMMVIGALSGFFFGYISNSFLVGIIMAMTITGIFSLIHAFMVLTLKANQVVSGLSMTFLGLGLTSFLGRNFIGKTAPFIRGLPVPFLSGIPFVGEIFFNQNLLVYFSFIVIPLLWFFLYRTKNELNLQVCGESPITADTAGINVLSYRYLSVSFWWNHGWNRRSIPNTCQCFKLDGRNHIRTRMDSSCNCNFWRMVTC